MDEMAGLFLLAQGEFTARVDAVGAEQWADPTIDSEWDVGALVDHLIEENRWVAHLVGGATFAQAGDAVAALAGDEDRQQSWTAAAASSGAALAAPGALDGEVALSRGPTPAREYIAEMIFDHTIHSWDLGSAIGYDPPLPDQLVSAVYAIVEPLGDLSTRFTGMFAPPVPMPGDAPLIDKLVALTGRDPSSPA